MQRPNYSWLRCQSITRIISGPLIIDTDLDYYAPDRYFQSPPDGAPDSDWTGKDHASRRIIVRDGVLYALDSENRERTLKDFNPDERRLIVSLDWAWVW